MPAMRCWPPRRGRNEVSMRTRSKHTAAHSSTGSSRAVAAHADACTFSGSRTSRDWPTRMGVPLFLQPKLAISQPSDPYEQEADRVAEQVMRMPALVVQRQCAACAAGGPPCPTCQDEPITVSRKAHGSAGGEAPPSVHSVLASPGQPLPASTRAFFEPRLGQDLRHVRVHTDGHAQQSAQDVSALAYTVGSHVVFDAGRYAPHSTEGQRLLAHELTHVVQQTSSGSVPPVIARKQANWPAWHQEILQHLIAMVGVVGKEPADIRWRWLQRYLCGLSQDRAGSLFARWNRNALAVPGNKDDFPLFVLAHFGEHYDDAIALLKTLQEGKKPETCVITPDTKTPQSGPSSSPATPAVKSDGASPQTAPPEESPDLSINECDDASFCQPYTDLAYARGVKLATTLALTKSVYPSLCVEAQALWTAYLSRTPGADMTPQEFRSPDSSLAKFFGADPVTVQHQEDILEAIVDYSHTLPIDVFADKPIFYRVSVLLPPGKQHSLLSQPLEFDAVVRSPDTALTAGGAGGSDQRAVSGMIAIEPSVKNDITGEQNYRVTTQLSLWVKDTIDFCPGKCGAPLEQFLTVPLSRLEATGLVYDVPFEVFADIKPVSYDYLESDLGVRVRPS